MSPHFDPATERPEHNQIGPELAKHCSEIERVSLARDEPELVEHLGQKHPHMALVLDDAGPWRYWPAPELNDLAPALIAVVAGHGAVSPQRSSRCYLRGAYDI